MNFKVFATIFLLIIHVFRPSETYAMMTISTQPNEVDDTFDEGSGGAYELNENFNFVSKFPMLYPPCLLPTSWVSSSNHLSHSKESLTEQRDVLTIDELLSEKVQILGQLAIEKYMSSRNHTKLILTEYSGGCKEKIAGELLYLIFNAKEIALCQNSNCTEPTVTQKECRARVHISTMAPWNPFFVDCHPKEYYALPWRGVNV